MPSVKFLEHCQPLALVRMQIDQNSCFAFLAAHKNAFIPAFAFMPSGRWEVLNLSSGHGFLHSFEGAAAVDFCKDFEIQIDYADHCEIDKGPLFRSPGAIICTSETTLLAACGATGWRDGVQYLDLKSGETSSEPGGSRVAF